MAKLSDEELELIKKEAYSMTGVAERVGEVAESQGQLMSENYGSNGENNEDENKATEDGNPSSSPSDPPQVTDKELLALCSLSNLRLEFGNFKVMRRAEYTGEDHTVFSFIDQEYNSIMGEKTGRSERRAMYNYDVDENLEEPTIPMYNSVDELKIEAGIFMEYYEKGKLENKESEFLNDWNPLHAADGYGIVKELIDFMYGDGKACKYVIKGSMRDFLYIMYEGDMDKTAEALDIILMLDSDTEDEDSDDNNDNDEENEDNDTVELSSEDVVNKLLSFELDLESNQLDIIDEVYGDLVSIPDSIHEELLTFFAQKVRDGKIDEKGLYDSRIKNVEKLKNQESYLFLTDLNI